VKETQEKDKIRSKPEKKGKRGEAKKNQKQLQSVEEEKLKKMQKEGPELQIIQALFKKFKYKGCFCNLMKDECKGLILPSMIGSLMYVTSSRPDIMFATCMCARYQANPNEHHVSAVKRIFRYFKGTINLGLWYPKDSGFDLTAYSDADHAGCHLDRKTESEYVAVSGCCAQVLWMRTQLTDYGFFYDKVPIYCDSKSAIAISCNPVQHMHTKHIDVRYHFIKDHVERGTIELYFVGTEYQLAHLFTKSLPEARFKFLVKKLGMMSCET
nr:copia protein [Tanacetum cinerariifolium]